MENTKKCIKCNQVKEVKEFSKDSRNKDKLHAYCKSCSSIAASTYQKSERKTNPVKHYKKTFWTSINQRAVNGAYATSKSILNNPQHQSYHEKGILVAMSKEMFDEWYDKNSNIVLELVAQGKTPSIDRIDDFEDYEVGNIQIIDNQENRKKQRKTRKPKSVENVIDFKTWDSKR